MRASRKAEKLTLDMLPIVRAHWCPIDNRCRWRTVIPVKHTYPVRLSTDELRQELDAYLDARQRAEKASATIDLDRRKVLYFLDWLDSGIMR
jgi:hypothetical protein